MVSIDEELQSRVLTLLSADAPLALLPLLMAEPKLAFDI